MLEIAELFYLGTFEYFYIVHIVKKEKKYFLLVVIINLQMNKRKKE